MEWKGTDGGSTRVLFDKEVMMPLLEPRGDDVQVTEEVVKLAAENWRSGKEVIMVLLGGESPT